MTTPIEIFAGPKLMPVVADGMVSRGKKPHDAFWSLGASDLVLK